MFTTIRLIQRAGRRRMPSFSRPALVLCGVLAGGCFAGTAGAAIKVAILAPDPPGASAHWDRTLEVMRAAAEDLEIELQVAYSKTNTYTNRKEGLKLLNDPEKPDFFITGYWSGSTDHLLKRAEGLGVRTFVISSAVMPADRDTVGEPRHRYEQWLGAMGPDGEQAAHELARRLVAKAGRERDAGTIHVLALGGFGDTSADLFRIQGLKAYLESDADAVLDELLLAQWSRETAYESVKGKLSVDSPISVIWSASDAMALGALQAAREAAKKPGEYIFIGGFDWTAEALKAVADGDMEATAGGHFLEGAWALVLLFDFHQGRDFADDLGTQFQTPLRVLTAADAQQYLDVLEAADWSAVDFRQFSKVHNPDLNSYQWPLEQVFEQLR